MRHIDRPTLLTLQDAGTAQQDVGEANSLRVYAEFGS
jgi:hypothetical protein